VKELRQLLRLTQDDRPDAFVLDIDAHIAARRECLEFHIGRCTGPASACSRIRTIARWWTSSANSYRGGGKRWSGGLRALERRVGAREYERAGALRDQVRRLESVLARQRMVDVSGSSVDVLGWRGKATLRGSWCCASAGEGRGAGGEVAPGRAPRPAKRVSYART